MSRNLRFFTAASAVLLLLCASAIAQVTTGNLQGVIKDPNGAVVSGASVKITNTATGVAKETTTNNDGFYRVTNLIPGNSYKIDVTAQGFAPLTLENLAVLLGTENSADAQVQLSGAAETVTVTSAQGELLQSTQNQLSTDFSPKQVTQLPLNGAGIDTLALLVPGNISTGDTTFTNGVGISANGNRGRSNNFQIDGQDNNDNSVAGPSLLLTNTEAVGAFQVVTNNFSAEFGRNSGAQVNSITKSGTNDFRGSIFAFHSNSALNALNNLQKTNARSFAFLAENGISDFQGLADRKGVDPTRANTYGFAIGGPIKKNRAFFFATYQGVRTRGEAVVSNLNSGLITFDAPSALLARQLFPNAATPTGTECRIPSPTDRAILSETPLPRTASLRAYTFVR